MSVPVLRGSFAPGTVAAGTQPLLVLLPSLGTTTALWDGVVARLRADAAGARLRILRVDLPGHGASPVATEPFTIAELAEAVLAIVDEAGGGAFHVGGVSLGGTVALELAAAHPDRVRSLFDSCSGARIGTPDGWADRAASVRASGTASLVTGSAERWFAPGFLGADDGAGSRALHALVEIDDDSYARCAEALAGFDRTADLPAIDVPALLVSGQHDAVTTPASMQEMADAMPDAVHVELDDVSHLAVLEAPDAAADLLLGHILRTEAGAEASAAHARGMQTRRGVLGDAHVDRAIAGTTPETAAFQDFITRYAWGEIWSRPGLSRRERSIATLASLVTSGHEAELRMHVRAALRNGLSPDEISEVLLHTALYAGLPPVNGGLAIAREVFAEVAADEASDRASDPEPGSTDPH
ncbi:3-oxoadipate enol-lactonase [Agromyces rhizosphaerae]|uniref:3-oxoadipate enol-lactonase n=1 Tax=Agromyces rhizosphaerae TaxID=88374 RepID=A0A9W6FNJ9_9MICO|nr:alpha/beta fold hydrolase [Agromyces rhizosphaerae]GLI26581.1 3-oxoadipate enol-lactonase [Agromyces rhizosphaerae]